jgi:hypothetical protein
MAALDKFTGFYAERVDSPAVGALTVSPHDTTTLTTASKALYVGTGGNIAVLMLDGTTATFTAVPTGTVLPIRVQRVNSTNTTASNMVALI